MAMCRSKPVMDMDGTWSLAPPSQRTLLGSKGCTTDAEGTQQSQALCNSCRAMYKPDQACDKGRQSDGGEAPIWSYVPHSMLCRCSAEPIRMACDFSHVGYFSEAGSCQE